MKLFLEPHEAAALLGISREMLMRSRAPRVRWGARTVRFRKEELLRWIEETHEMKTKEIDA